MEVAFAPAAAAVVVAGLGLELRLFAPSRAPRRGEAIAWTIGWLLVAAAVTAGIALAGGPTGEWTTVYLIERSLSLDNVFLFSLLLGCFLVPPELRGRVILIGIAGALLLRGVAIAAGLAWSRAWKLSSTSSESCWCTSPFAPSVAPPKSLTRPRTRSFVSSGARCRPRLTSVVGGCSSARRGGSTALRCCSWSSRSSSPTSRLQSTRSRRPSRSPATRS